MNVVIIQPPIVQLNTPYPSGAYLQDFFKKLSKSYTEQNSENPKIGSVIWKDLSIELFHAIFCKDGIKKLFDLSSKKALQIALSAEQKGDEITAFNLRRFVINSQKWENYIDKIVAVLCGKQNGREFLHEFVRSAHIPRGSRVENFLANLKHDVSVDDAFMLASLSLADLADYITTVFDPNFALIRYAESLSASEACFSAICASTEAPIMKEYFAHLGQKFLASLPKTETLFCVSVPFPGTFAPALLTCKLIKSLFGDLATVVIGGGYVNTALRTVNDNALFNFVDALSYDRGYGFYAKFFDNYKNPTFKIEDCNNLEENYIAFEQKMTQSVVPDYSGIDFAQYPRLSDDVNPMHRIWSDGSWLKAYLAHGCYWHKCLFCDTTLDYVKCYKPVNISSLYNSLVEQAKQTGVYGVHFVDEAAPPLLLQEFAQLNTNNSLSFWGNIRFEKSFTRDLTDILAKGGLIGVSGGIEIACTDGLLDINKGIDINSLVNALAAFKESGILVHAYMIFGYYNETPQMLIDSAEMLRQLFAAGLLDSAFWHKFSLTKHSTLYSEWEQGKHPNLKPIFPPKTAFANYELHFEGEEKSNKYSSPLNNALNDWMHGKSLEKPIEKWFNFAMPKPSISKNFVNNAIENYESLNQKRFSEDLHNSINSKNFAWIGDKIITIPVENGKNKTTYQLCWFYMGEIFYSETEFSSLEQANTVISELLSLSTFTEKDSALYKKNIQIPKKLFFELRGKGLAKKI